MINRIKALQKELEYDMCVIENPVDLLYLTGVRFSLGILLVAKKGAELFVDGRYIQVASEKAAVKATLVSEKAQVDFCKKHKVKTIGFDSTSTSYESFLKLKKRFASSRLIPLSAPVMPLRLIKEKEEVALMKKSADLLWKGFSYIQNHIKEGMTEKKLAKMFEVYCLESGAEGMAFEPIVAFGPNSAMPHYRAGDARLKKGDLVLIDIGVILNNYHSDMTRIVFFGDVDPKLKKMYEVVREAQKAALKKCKAGVKVKDLDLAARAVMKKAGMEDLFVHSLGHGIGLETHETPRIIFSGVNKDMILKPGMVITIEPGLYVPGLGGVRYEDTVCITKTGYNNFFPDV